MQHLCTKPPLLQEWWWETYGNNMKLQMSSQELLPPHWSWKCWHVVTTARDLKQSGLLWPQHHLCLHHFLIKPPHPNRCKDNSSQQTVKMEACTTAHANNCHTLLDGIKNFFVINGVWIGEDPAKKWKLPGNCHDKVSFCDKLGNFSESFTNCASLNWPPHHHMWTKTTQMISRMIKSRKPIWMSHAFSFVLVLAKFVQMTSLTWWRITDLWTLWFSSPWLHSATLSIKRQKIMATIVKM